VIAAANIPAEPIVTNLNNWERSSVCRGKADARDNAAMESFFGSLKEECVVNQVYSSQEQARQALFEYLEVYYNRQRRHSALGYVSPVVYEQRENQYVTHDV
jgi:transposase InsO family protein